MSNEHESTHPEIQGKEVVDFSQGMTEEREIMPDSEPLEKQISPEIDDYYQTKAQDHERIVALIADSEKELADLKLRKSLMECDFSNLMVYFNELILGGQKISTIAMKTFLEYLSYEFLKPLKSIDLKQTTNYDIWSTRHFLVSYVLTDEHVFEFSFKLNSINQKVDSQYIPLLAINPAKKQVTVKDEQVLRLIYFWHAQNIFSSNQLSLFNYDINLILSHLRELGFDVTPSLLDNTKELSVELEIDSVVPTEIFDTIFITTMENDLFDFEKNAENHYDILLDNGQKVGIEIKTDRHRVSIYSDRRKRSLLDFLTNYPFVVPLLEK